MNCIVIKLQLKHILHKIIHSICLFNSVIKNSFYNIISNTLKNAIFIIIIKLMHNLKCIVHLYKNIINNTL